MSDRWLDTARNQLHQKEIADDRHYINTQLNPAIIQPQPETAATNRISSINFIHDQNKILD
jgi:hypothetical protein